ncbi:HTH-type transcriptional regulator CysL [Baekduia alba]|uniref:LysR family transcriptional regulator n=1 Tax=Baekduia alba TaxID=2997333 RepID=UPI0023421CD8|nr:LysR family transcriptional regulator [Baekduia alba]WCB93334.1 HTH-type transcriptional regulator CysL [Baekduia alba]
MSYSAANPLPGSDLAAFVAAVEAGSLHGAADALDLTQSAVTKRIKALEKRVGVRLLERGRFGARPTKAGELLYPDAKRALHALAIAETTLTAHRDDLAGGLRLSASYTIGEVLLPDWLAAFRSSHPEIRAQLEVVNSMGVLRAVREGRSDIGFVEGCDDLHGLDTMVVAKDEIAVIVASDHRWVRRAQLEPAVLAREPYIARESGSGTRAVAAAALSPVGLELRADLELASTQSVKRALTRGGFSLMSRLTVEAEERAGTLHSLPIRGIDLSRELRAVRNEDTVRSPATTAFWRWLADRAHD